MPNAVFPRRESRAASRDTTLALGRSGRYLVRASAVRLAAPPATACLNRYRYVTSVEKSAKLLRTDLLVELIDVHRLRAVDIARQTGERQSDLSEMYAVGKVFPRESRPDEAVYNDLLLATRMFKRFRAIALSPAEVLGEIMRAGLTQHRDVSRHFDRLARDIAAQVHDRRILPSTAASSQDKSLINRAHHAKFQDLLTRFADGSIQILSIDPPYVFERAGTTYAARSASSLECDSGDDPAAAVGLVVDLLREWQPKLATGGVVLLWQPWQSLLESIATAARKYGWTITGPIVWDKSRPQPGRFDAPYAVQGEFLWLLQRAGDRLVDHEGGSRRMILHYSPVSFPRSVRTQLHAFEKPLDLNEHLVLKHSRPGDLVVDACACSGSMSLAAMRTGRRWVYIESNANNFALGRDRLENALAESRIKGPLTVAGDQASAAPTSRYANSAVG